jgi:hypothetical protein
MMVDHITALLALLMEDPLRSAAISRIRKRYIPEDASYILSQWEPHIQLPPSHPLAKADLAKDHTLAMLQATYTTPELEARDTHALTNLVYVATTVETFILFTAVTLREEEMAILTPYHPHPISGLLALPPITNGALATVFTLPSRLTRLSAADPLQPHYSSIRITIFRATHQIMTILSPLFLSPPRWSKMLPSATGHPCPRMSLLAKV